MIQRVALFLVLASALPGQKPEYAFYSEFRPMMRQNRGLPRAQIFEKYAAKLKAENVAESEIQRRVRLLNTSLDALEDDYWNRYFTEGKTNYNTAPNAFLTEIVEGRKPGTALDVGMGAGRNAIYLAKLGWTVHGIDPAAQAVASANQSAKSLGLKIETSTVRDTEYEYGQNRFDLILYSWTRPTTKKEADKAVASLKPGGIIVMECGADWFPNDGSLKLFPLPLSRYEIVKARSDFFNRQEMDVLRIVARKP